MVDSKIKEIAYRLKGLREMSDISAEEMAKSVDVNLDEYLEYELGNRDYSFTFLYKCSEKLGIDVVELMTGESPTLTGYTVVRAGKGLEVKRRVNFEYRHLAHLFKNKLAEPFVVTAPYTGEKELKLSTHTSQEFDYVLSGSLRVSVDGHTEILHTGDSIYYDSNKPHGMTAVNGEPCTFLAIVIK